MQACIRGFQIKKAEVFGLNTERCANILIGIRINCADNYLARRVVFREAWPCESLIEN